MSAQTRVAVRASIIIPNYNGRNHLETLLPSIADQTFHDYEVIVIDDSSPDRSAVEYIKSFVTGRADFRLVENDENLGFVRNCNKGFRLAQGDYVCILTNDTRVEPNFIQRNVEITEADASIGVLSCVIVDQDGHNWFSGGLYRNGVRTNLQDDFHGVRQVDWVAGTACFYRRELLNKIGLLDETLVMYNEDIDFCLRVTRQTTYRVCMFSDKLVTHYLLRHEPLRLGVAKLARLLYYRHRNSILLARRYCPRAVPSVATRGLGEIVAWPMRVIRARTYRQLLLSWYVAAIIMQGTLSGLLKRSRALAAPRGSE